VRYQKWHTNIGQCLHGLSEGEAVTGASGPSYFALRGLPQSEGTEGSGCHAARGEGVIDTMPHGPSKKADPGADYQEDHRIRRAGMEHRWGLSCWARLDGGMSMSPCRAMSGRLRGSLGV